MKILYFLLLTLLISILMGCDQAIPINELPMYGGADKTAIQKSCDEEFINQMTMEYGSAKEASEEVVKHLIGLM